MESQSSGNAPGSKSVSRITIGVILVLVTMLLCVSIAMIISESQRDSIGGAFYRSLGRDLRRGDVQFKGTKAMLQEEQEKGKVKQVQAEEQLQDALRRQKQHRAEDKAKREKAKAAKEAMAKRPYTEGR